MDLVECLVPRRDLDIRRVLQKLLRKHYSLQAKSKPSINYSYTHANTLSTAPSLTWGQNPVCTYHPPQNIDKNWNIFDSIIPRIFQQYSDTFFTKIVGQSAYLHISALYQFLLDCYVSDKKFLKKILKSVKKKVWITSRDLANCLKSAITSSSKNFISSHFFFFCIIQKQGEKHLDFLQLLHVLQLASNFSSNRQKFSASFFLQQNSTINFQEFQNLLLKHF